MADPIGLCYWPGIAQVESADFTLSHGIRPSVCQITCPAQGVTPGEHGDLVFTFGSTTITFADCKLADMSQSRDGSGIHWHLSIWDKRWKWAWGELDGSYNTRLSNGELDRAREKTPQELAKLCLAEMGESKFNVSQIPNKSRPQVDWAGDVPAQALDSLVEELGCRVVLQPDGTVLIARLGVGQELPAGQLTDDADTIDPPERPESLVFLAGPTRYQFELGLEAVGVDLDGKIKMIDDLSYKPANGWGAEDPEFFSNVDEPERFKAQQTVWKWYRIFYDAKFQQPLSIPGYGEIQDGWQILPIEDEQVVSEEDEWELRVQGQPVKSHSLPAEVRGIFGDHSEAFNNSSAGEKWPYNFEILKDLGIVVFDRPVYAYGTAGQDPVADRNVANGDILVPAKITLIASCSIRNAQTRAWVRYRKVRKIGNVPTPARVLRHDDVVLAVDTFALNFDEVEREANACLDAAETEYATVTSKGRTYAGLLNLAPDGKIQQVHWHVGSPFASTQVSLNREFSVAVDSYAQRRQAWTLNRQFIRECKDWLGEMRAKKRDRGPFRAGDGQAGAT